MPKDQGRPNWSLVLGYGQRPRWWRIVLIGILLMVVFLLGPVLFGIRIYRRAQPVFDEIERKMQRTNDPRQVLDDVTSRIRGIELRLVDRNTGGVFTSDSGADTGGSVDLRFKRDFAARGHSWSIAVTRKTPTAQFFGDPAFIASAVLAALIIAIAIVSGRRRRWIDFSERMLDDLSDAIEVLDLNGVVVFASGSLTKILDRPPAEIIGRPFVEFIESGDVAAVQRVIDRTNLTDEPVPLVRFRISGETTRYIDGTVRAMRDRDRRVGTLVAIHDTTATVQLERQLEQAVRIESLGRVAASVAHEFNNVLMAVGINTSVLLRRPGTDEGSRAICEQMQRSVGRGKRIAEQILRFSRPAELHMEPIVVREWLAALEEELRPILRDTTLDVQMPPEDLTIVGDREQLGQVVTNLVLNARDAMNSTGHVAWTVSRESGGHFRFGIVPEGRFVHLTVRDQGEGIPPDRLDRIFEPLFTTKKSGTGLGLTVSYQIVRDHGGLMFAESTPGQGTDMHVFLPAS